MKRYFELTNDQARQSIDVAQVFRSWRDAAVQTWNGHGGEFVAPMSWRKERGHEYLVARKLNYRKHYGPRSRETEKLYREYTHKRNRIIERMKSTYARLKKMAPVNRALGLGRMPKLTADILRELDQHGFLGSKILVVGTNALYAYEAKAGIHIHSPLLETGDADLLWDSRERLTLAIDKLKPPAVLALLRKADPTFDASKQYGFSAENEEGFIVELLSVDSGEIEETGLPDDLSITPMVGMDALLAFPKFEAVVIDRRGMPARVVVPEIRIFTLLKEWTSRQSGRAPAKRRRDRDQAKVLRQIADEELGLHFDAKEMREVPEYLSAL
jgi:hypothetical protein